MPNRSHRWIVILLVGSVLSVALILAVQGPRGWFHAQSPAPSPPPAEYHAGPEDRKEWPTELNGRGNVRSSRDDSAPQRPMRPFQTIPSH